MAVPGAFSPVLIGGQHYVDGALVENLPVFVAKDSFHPDLTLAVDVSSPLESRSARTSFRWPPAAWTSWWSAGSGRAAPRPASWSARSWRRWTSWTTAGQLPAMVAAGRKAFDAAVPALKAAVLDRLGGEAGRAGHGGCVYHAAGPLPEGAGHAGAGAAPRASRPAPGRCSWPCSRCCCTAGPGRPRPPASPRTASRCSGFDFTPFGPVRPVAGGRARSLARGDRGGPADPLPAGRSRSTPRPSARSWAAGCTGSSWTARRWWTCAAPSFQEDSGVLRVVVREPRISTVTVLAGGQGSEARYLQGADGAA